jgi:hypothetical protein
MVRWMVPLYRLLYFCLHHIRVPALPMAAYHACLLPLLLYILRCTLPLYHLLVYTTVACIRKFCTDMVRCLFTGMPASAFLLRSRFVIQFYYAIAFLRCVFLLLRAVVDTRYLTIRLIRPEPILRGCCGDTYTICPFLLNAISAFYPFCGEYRRACSDDIYSVAIVADGDVRTFLSLPVLRDIQYVDAATG